MERAVLWSLVSARHHSDQTFSASKIHVSNITDSAVTCRVKVYDYNGNDLSSYCHVTTGDDSTYFKTLSTGVNTFVLPAHSSRVFSFFKKNMSKSVVGYAVIEWTSENEDLRKALIATHRLVGAATHHHMGMVMINNGQPF